MVEQGRTVTHLLGHDALVSKVLAQALHKVNLFLGGQAGNGRLQDAAHADVVDDDERVVVDVGKESHDELAVHAIGDAAVARNRVAKVLDLESALETGCEEAAKGGNERRKSGKNQGVELDRSKGDGELGVLWQEE